MEIYGVRVTAYRGSLSAIGAVGLSSTIAILVLAILKKQFDLLSMGPCLGVSTICITTGVYYAVRVNCYGNKGRNQFDPKSESKSMKNSSLVEEELEHQKFVYNWFVEKFSHKPQAWWDFSVIELYLYRKLFFMNFNGKIEYLTDNRGNIAIHFNHYAQFPDPRYPMPNDSNDKCFESYLSNIDLKRASSLSLCCNIDDEHWVLIWVDLQSDNSDNKEIEFYDSLVNYPLPQKMNNFLEMIKDSLGKEYKVVKKIKTPLHTIKDGQCGPWMCYLLEQKLKGKDLDFNNLTKDVELIVDYRKRVQKDIFDLKIS